MVSLSLDFFGLFQVMVLMNVELFSMVDPGLGEGVKKATEEVVRKRESKK